MLITIFLLIVCALVALLGVPLMMRLVPPNPYFGWPVERRASKPERWVEVNAFAGAALVAAGGFMALLLWLYNGTWLKSGWAQLLVFVFVLGAAVAATFCYDRFWYDRKRG
jgi:hypothetical protein